MAGPSDALVTKSPARNKWLEERLLRPGARGERKQMTLIDLLWLRLNTIFGAKFSSRFTSPELVDAWKLEWADALESDGVTFKQVTRALHHFRRKVDVGRDGVECWPPNLPEFLAVAAPVPDAQQAFFEAQQMMWRRHTTGDDEWSHPAVFWAAVDYGGVELRSAAWSSAKARWCKLLDARLRASWLPPVQRVAPVSARVECKPDRDVGRAGIARAREILRGRQSVAA